MEISRPSQVSPPLSTAVSKSISLVVVPGEGNVDDGDKSKNTAQITLAAPKKEVSAEISREQAFDFVGLISQRKALLSYLSPQPSGSVPLKIAALKNSGIEKGDAAPLAEELITRKQIQAYYNGVNTLIDNDKNSGSNNTAPSNDVDLYNKAVDVYIKQTLFFSRLDNAQGFSAKA